MYNVIKNIKRINRKNNKMTCWKYVYGNVTKNQHQMFFNNNVACEFNCLRLSIIWIIRNNKQILLKQFESNV
ncbi:hypothetical protein [Candidatus Hodgkinia cicadicola]|uniref:hypothetical protein n=1 Tax=Candidatus Hodgkinia cicadicola TaxID=573658 RepID=UPI001788BAF6